jgi:hypothetical protein
MDWAWAQGDTAIERALAVALAHQSDCFGQCEPTVDELAHMMAVSARAVRQARARLVKRGALRVQMQLSQPNLYTLLLPWIAEGLRRPARQTVEL